MDQPGGVDAAVYRLGWRERITRFASIFVILSLAALAVIPVVIVREVSRAIDENSQTFEPARRRVRDLRFLYEHQVAELRGLVLTGDVRFLQSYQDARRTEQETLDRLTPLIFRIGSDAPERLEEVIRYSTLWHAANDSLLAGALTIEQYVERLPRQFALNDSTVIAAERLAAVIDRQAVRFFGGLGEILHHPFAHELGQTVGIDGAGRAVL